MSEEFLQFIWEHRLFDAHNFLTVKGERIEVVNPGTRNTDSGPDFFNAMVRLDDTLWVGNVEIHRSASDWLRHHHQADEAYDNTILHVVNDYDLAINRTNGEEIPAAELVYPSHLLENYRHLLASAAWIPCQDKFHSIDPFLLKIGFNRLMVERLQEKTSEISGRLAVNHNDWNETFYQFLARNFGFKINALPFELLAKSLPLGIIGKHADHLPAVEALLFGQSGLLNETLLGDDYFLGLREEYGFLFRKYNLRPVGGHLWKFLRLRPVNFPTVRIAQLAALLSRTKGLFSAITETGDLGKLTEIFDVSASPYWDTHYKFSYVSGKSVKHLGESAIHNIIINTVVPFLFVFGEQHNKPHLKDRALEWLDKLPAEENAIMNKWKELGVNPLSAFESQALLQLKNGYCKERKCLKCHVGNKLVRQNGGMP